MPLACCKSLSVPSSFFVSRMARHGMSCHVEENKNKYQIIKLNQIIKKVNKTQLKKGRIVNAWHMSRHRRPSRSSYVTWVLSSSCNLSSVVVMMRSMHPQCHQPSKRLSTTKRTRRIPIKRHHHLVSAHFISIFFTIQQHNQPNQTNPNISKGPSVTNCNASYNIDLISHHSGVPP